MNNASALRWGVTLVGVILTGHCSPYYGIPFSGTGHMQATDPHPGPIVMKSARRIKAQGAVKAWAFLCKVHLILHIYFLKI